VQHTKHSAFCSRYTIFSSISQALVDAEHLRSCCGCCWYH
jgi:hypothetical protein